MYSNNLLKTFCLFSVFITVLSDRTDNVKNRSKRTVGLLLSGLSNFLNVHDELQVTTPISITTSAPPNYNKRPPPPKVQKWPPLDFEITPYVLSLISAKKPQPTEAPTYVPPTEEPYYQAQVFFVPLRDLENHLNGKHEQKINSNSYAYNTIGQQSQQSLPNLLYADPVSRNRLIPERYAQKHVQQSPALQSNHQTNNRLHSGNRQSTNSTTKKKPTLQQKEIDEILEKLSSIFANPHDGELTRIAGNDVSNDKTQYMSFIDQEPRLGFTRQQVPEKNKDLLNLYLLERMQRLQNSVNNIRIPTSINNVVKKPKSNPPEETKVEIIKSVEPEMRFSTDSDTQSHKTNLDTDPAIGDSDESNKNHAKEARDDDETSVSYDIARSLEFPILNSSSRPNYITRSNVEADNLYHPINRPSSISTENGGETDERRISTPQIERFRKVENHENSPIQIHFSPSIEAVKNYDNEDGIHVTRSFPKTATESYDEADTPSNFQQTRFLGHPADDVPPRSEFRYPVPLSSPYNVFRQNQKAAQNVDGSGIFKERIRQLTRTQNSKIKSLPDSNYPFSTSANGPENQYDRFHSQRPKQETQLHFFLPDEDSLRRPEQFSKPNNHYEDPRPVDDYQYQRDDFYQSSREDFGNFPYQLGSREVDSRFPIPKALHSPRLPDDIHDELYNSISRSHLGPPPAFDQDIAKSELRTKSVSIRRGRELFQPLHTHNKNSPRIRYQ